MFISNGSVRQVVGAALVGLIFTAHVATAAVGHTVEISGVPLDGKIVTLVVTVKGWSVKKVARLRALLERIKTGIKVCSYRGVILNKRGQKIAKIKLAMRQDLSEAIKAVKKDAKADIKDVKQNGKAARKDASGAVKKLAIKNGVQNDVANIEEARDAEIAELELQNIKNIVAEVQEYLA